MSADQDPKIVAAEALLKDPKLLDRAEQAIEHLGLCGEEINRRLVFLAAIGGHLNQPIHLVVHGQSSGGKNTLLKIPLMLFPEDRVLMVSSLSAQALVYNEKPLEGILVIDEAEGQEDAEYSLRQAMSEGKVRRMTVNKSQSGRHTGETVGCEIKASIFTTTTAPRLHAENQTRVFDLWIDESEEQTRRVNRRTAERAAGRTSELPEAQIGVWQMAIGCLDTKPVTVPFAVSLSDQFPSREIRTRRDLERTLRLIQASALLHQRQRKQIGGAILASIDDYRIVYPILQVVLERSISGLNDTALAIFDLHNEFADDSGWVERIKVERAAAKRELASRNTVHVWCKRLSKEGFLEGDLHFRKWRHRVIRDPREEPIAIPRPEELETESIALPKTSQAPDGRLNTNGHNALLQTPNLFKGIELRAPLGAIVPFDLSAAGWEEHLTSNATTPSTSHPPIWESLGGRGSGAADV